MSDTEQSAPAPPSPTKPARKTAARRQHKPAVAAPKQSEMAGITPGNCPDACKPTRCCISGRAICSHPHKGGLQSGSQSPEAMRRFNEAKRLLGKQKLDLS